MRLLFERTEGLLDPFHPLVDRALANGQFNAHQRPGEDPVVRIQEVLAYYRLGHTIGGRESGVGAVELAQHHPLARQAQADFRIVGALLLSGQQILVSQRAIGDGVRLGCRRPQPIESRSGHQGRGARSRTGQGLVEPVQGIGLGLGALFGRLDRADLHAGLHVLVGALRVVLQPPDQRFEDLPGPFGVLHANHRLGLSQRGLGVVRGVFQPAAGNIGQFAGVADRGVDHRQLLIRLLVARVQLDHPAIRADCLDHVRALERPHEQPRLRVFLEDLDVVGVAAQVLLEMLVRGRFIALLEGGRPRF